MNFPNTKDVERMRKDYPEKSRVKLISMNDPYAPPTGTEGTVEFVDSMATVHVAWDNGSHLGVVYGEDAISKI